MALTEQVILDIQDAQRQIDQLESELGSLGAPINVPVEIDSQGAAGLQSDLEGARSGADALNRELDDTSTELREVDRRATEAGDELETAGRRGETSFRNAGAAVVGLVAAFGAIQGARAFLSFASDAVQAAANLEESTSKAGVVFGDFFDDIERFASTAPQSLGLTNQAALEFTATFGNLFTALGLSQQAASQLSPEIVQLGADLASFNNISVDDALTALQSGLVGQVEPLRRFGVALSAAAVEAKVLELGLADSAGEIDESAKVQARYQLILEQTATAQGDFARTADSVANQQRILNAEWEDARARLGEALIPAYQSLLELAPEIINVVESGLAPAFATLASAIDGVDTGPVIVALANLPAAGERIATTIGSAASSVGNFAQALAGLITFNQIGTVDAFGDALQDLSNIRISNRISQSIQDLITTMVGGTEPIQAFESVLVNLRDADLPEDAFENLVSRLGQIAGLGPEDAAGLLALRDTILTVGEQIGFSSFEVDTLAASLLDLARGGIDPADIALRNLGRTAGDIDLEPVAEAAEELESIFAGVDFQDDIARLERQFNSLPDAFDAAGAALRNEQNEIVTSFGEFFENLEGEISARRTFRDNIALLEAMGLENLAQVFTDAGLDSAQALADGLSDPDALRRAEAQLEADLRAAAASAREVLAQTLLEPIDLTIPVNATAAVQSLVLEGFDPSQALAEVVATGARPGAPIIQNFQGFVPSSTDLARASQSVNAITLE